jgi:bacterioferritin
MKAAKRSAAVVEFTQGKRRGAAVREVYRGDRAAVLALLHDALATKLAAALRYRQHHFVARVLASRRICEELLVHSDEELSHADLIAERIVELGGNPDFSPAAMVRHADARARSIVDLIEENLLAARSALDTYRGLIAQLGEDDPITRRMLEGILAVKEAHADELADLLQGANKIG